MLPRVFGVYENEPPGGMGGEAKRPSSASTERFTVSLFTHLTTVPLTMMTAVGLKLDDAVSELISTVAVCCWTAACVVVVACLGGAVVVEAWIACFWGAAAAVVVGGAVVATGGACAVVVVVRV